MGKVRKNRKVKGETRRGLWWVTNNKIQRLDLLGFRRQHKGRVEGWACGVLRGKKIIS
jgi:hypothetical protein